MDDGAQRETIEVSLLVLFLAFFRLGCTSFGGGTGAWVYREMVQRRRWIDEQVFLVDMALGQSLPGSNGLKMAVLVGRRVKGGVGAFTAPFAMLIGPFIIILLVGATYGRVADTPHLHAVFDGVAATVVGLTLSTGVGAIANGTPDPISVTFAALTVVGVGVLGWPMLPVVLTLAPVSIGLAWMRARRQRLAR